MSQACLVLLGVYYQAEDAYGLSWMTYTLTLRLQIQRYAGLLLKTLTRM